MAGGGNMEYPFGFEGFENRESPEDDPHPTHQELQSYCERHGHALEESGQDEFVKIEKHMASCDYCLMALTRLYPSVPDDEPKD
jgi:hypothetical protein